MSASFKKATRSLQLQLQGNKLYIIVSNCFPLRRGLHTRANLMFFLPLIIQLQNKAKTSHIQESYAPFFDVEGKGMLVCVSFYSLFAFKTQRAVHPCSQTISTKYFLSCTYPFPVLFICKKTHTVVSIQYNAICMYTVKSDRAPFY